MATHDRNIQLYHEYQRLESLLLETEPESRASKEQVYIISNYWAKKHELHVSKDIYTIIKKFEDNRIIRHILSTLRWNIPCCVYENLDLDDTIYNISENVRSACFVMRPMNEYKDFSVEEITNGLIVLSKSKRKQDNIPLYSKYPTMSICLLVATILTIPIERNY